MRYLTLLYALIFSLSVCPAQANETGVAESADSRPNVLFAFADDWGQQASAYAEQSPGRLSDCVQTPNFDRMAREGVLFTNAFVNAPSCTPCRSSLFSGRNFWETGRGAILRGAVWDETIPTFPLLMKDVGYHIGFSAKAWTPGTPAHQPFGGVANQFNRSGSRFNGFSQTLSKNRDRLDDAKKDLLNEVRANFADFIEAKGENQPFLYFWGPTNVHRKWVQGSGLDFWGINPDSLEGKVPGFLPDVPVVRQDLADYLGEVQAFDLGLGALIAELEKLGELENTIVIISGDHGAPGFTNGKCSLYDFGTKVPLAVRMPNANRKNINRIVDDLISIPDIAPTILELCQIELPESMSAKSFVNILESRESGVVDKDRTFVVTGRERHVAEARTGNRPYPQRAIRTAEFLFIRNFEPDRWPMGTGPDVDAGKSLPAFEKIRENTRAAWADMDASPTKAWIAHNCLSEEYRIYFQHAFGRRPARELYSVTDDPDQVRNLVDEPEYLERLKELESKLIAYLESTNDPRVTGDRMQFEKPPFTNGPRQ